MISGAIEALAATLQSADGRQIVYRRGSESVPITGVPGSTAFDTVTNTEIVERVEMRDFLILAAELVLSGAHVLPQRGDQIDEVFPHATYRYEVLPPTQGVKPYRFMDHDRTLLRVHTKQIA